MTSADLLDRAIDDIVAGRSLDDAGLGAEEVSLAAQAARLAGAARAVPLSPGRADIRRQVLTTVLEARPRRRWSRWFVLVPTTVLLLGGGLAVAAGKAAPGDALYSMRRAVSAMRVTVALGDPTKAVAVLNRAEGTLNEAAALASAGRLGKATKALRVFAGDLATARAEIAAASGDTSHLTVRADDLAARAARIAELIEDRRAEQTNGHGQGNGPKSAVEKDAPPGSGNGRDKGVSGDKPGNKGAR